MQGKYKRQSIYMLDWVLQGYNARNYKRGSMYVRLVTTRLLCKESTKEVVYLC